MKKIVLYMVLIQFLSWSCHKDELTTDRPTGLLNLQIGLYVSVDGVNESLKSTLGPEDFTVVIYNVSDQVVRTYARVAEMPDSIRLEAGTYYAVASFGTNPAAAFESPYYYGRSASFVITPGGLQQVVVNCQLANTVVAVVYSDNVRTAFSSYSTTVSSTAGSLVYGMTESRVGYFQPLPMTIRATLTWTKSDGSTGTRILTGSIPAPEARRRYEVHVNATGSDGASAFTVNVDEGTGQTQIVSVSESADTSAAQIAAGDLIISEIMYDPTALTDANGEWIEVYNTTGHSIDLRNLVLDKNGTDRHVINASVTVAAHGYLVLARTETAVPGLKYVYGTSVSLNNTGAVLTLSTYGTTGTDGTVIFSVNYGAAGFPSGTGASICLNPGRLNAADAASGANWCTSVTPFGTGDLGTPDAANDVCN
jgi:hypothetical protein